MKRGFISSISKCLVVVSILRKGIMGVDISLDRERGRCGDIRD